MSSRKQPLLSTSTEAAQHPAEEAVTRGSCSKENALRFVPASHSTNNTAPASLQNIFYSMNAALTQTVRPHACTARDAACSWSTGSASAARRGRGQLKLCAQVSAGRDEARWEEAKDRKKGVSWICRCENGCRGCCQRDVWGAGQAPGAASSSQHAQADPVKAADRSPKTEGIWHKLVKTPLLPCCEAALVPQISGSYFWKHGSPKITGLPE